MAYLLSSSRFEEIIRFRVCTTSQAISALLGQDKTSDDVEAAFGIVDCGS
jgi:hypothetical protein